jgi:hypothetical protein
MPEKQVVGKVVPVTPSSPPAIPGTWPPGVALEGGERTKPLSSKEERRLTLVAAVASGLLNRSTSWTVEGLAHVTKSYVDALEALV